MSKKRSLLPPLSWCTSTAMKLLPATKPVFGMVPMRVALPVPVAPVVDEAPAGNVVSRKISVPFT